MPALLPPRYARHARREVRYTLYLSPEELATLRERAAATRARATSAYIREAALGRTPPAAPPAVNHQAYVALGKLAGNLNQLAHHLNAGNVVTAELGRRLSAQLAETAELVRRLRLDLVARTLAEGTPTGRLPGWEPGGEPGSAGNRAVAP